VQRATLIDRKATSEEVMTHAAALRQLAADLGLSRPRLRRDGTVVVHSDEAAHRAVTRLSATASELIGHLCTHHHRRCARCDRRSGDVTAAEALDGLVATLEHLRWFFLMTRAFLDMTGLPDTTRSTSTSGLDWTGLDSGTSARVALMGTSPSLPLTPAPRSRTTSVSLSTSPVLTPR
jgi:hypothetical protein